MKIKVFSLILSIFVVLLTVVSCVSLPVENNSSAAEESKNSSAEQSPEQSESSAEAAESSDDESASSTEESSEDTSKAEESSAVSAEESSSVETSQSPVDLPYDSFDGITKDTIGSSEYDSYFENSMFIGNSIMVHFLNFNTDMRTRYPGFLGSCTIFASSNFSALQDSEPVSDDSWHPKYKTVKMNCADAITASGVDTVYLSVMALNEIALYNSSTCVQDNFNTTVQLINSIKAKSPNVRIVILSNTYMVYSHNSYAKLNNANISALNNKVLEYCNQNNIDYIDVATFLMDGNVLADKYCRDYDEQGQGCHLTELAYCLWTATLRNYACLKQNNAWKNPESMPTYTKNA